eukprot:6184655-Pleurochrysis_carterae.AAC.1
MRMRAAAQTARSRYVGSVHLQTSTRQVPGKFRCRGRGGRQEALVIITDEAEASHSFLLYHISQLCETARQR